MRDIICRNNIMRYALNPDFHRVFGVGLSGYWSNVTGFDIVAFDDRIVRSGDGCMADTVALKWGEAGRTLILQAVGTVDLTSAQLAEASAWLGVDHVNRHYRAKRERCDQASCTGSEAENG
jgi:hypothetical protein